MPKVGIIDVGLGNIFSVLQAFNQVGADIQLVKSNEEIRNIDIVVLPGVGSFGNMMDLLNKKDLVFGLSKHINSNKGFMGICLGMQLLFEYSEEAKNNIHGLSILNGSVRRIQSDTHLKSVKIPNTGWREIYRDNNNSLDTVYTEYCMKKHFYFMHSYKVDLNDAVDEAYFVDYGGQDILAAFAYKNILCTQFHPEKSGLVGLKLIEKFIGQVYG